LGTELGQIGDKKVNGSYKGSSEKLPYMHSFHAILHDNVHENLTAFPSMSCHCIFKIIFCIMTPHMLVHPQQSS